MLQLLRRSASPALLAGGGLMIAAEVIVWIVGFQTGKLAPKLGMNAPYFLTHIGYLASEVPVLLLERVLWGMYAQLDGRAKGLGHHRRGIGHVEYDHGSRCTSDPGQWFQ